MNMLIRALAKLVAAAILTHAATMYFRLGWFLPIVWAVGTVGAVFSTKPEWAQTQRRWGFASLAAFSYLIITTGSLYLLANRKHQKTFPMAWSDKGRNNDFKESEVVLKFSDHPESFIGIYSDELSAYLKNAGHARVDVSFEITSDFGCMRGFHETKIGELTRWKSRWGYSGINGNARDFESPWGAKSWWCR